MNNRMKPRSHLKHPRRLLSQLGIWSVMLACLCGRPAFGAGEPILIESLAGPVTSNEVAAFKTFMRARPTSDNNVGNDWVYGNAGKDTESLGMMFEITGDVEVLDEMIRFADAALACRNDPTHGRMIWTGKRELCWPNAKTNAAEAAYSGSENGDVIAHIGYCAKLILKTPAIASRSVAIGDANGFGKTYRARALTYVRELDRTMDTFILPHFVSVTDSNHYRWPEAPGYRALSARHDKDAGKPIPWNQQTMLSGGFLRLAECHELLGDDAARVKRYYAIVRANLDWFLSDLHPYERGGHTVYDWGYGPGRRGEDVPHSGYDVWGLCRAFDHGGFGVPAVTMTNFANTLRYVIHDPTNKVFHMRVDGTDGAKAPRKSLPATWVLLSGCSEGNELYDVVANANREPAQRRPLEFATIMTMKHRRAR